MVDHAKRSSPGRPGPGVDGTTKTGTTKTGTPSTSGTRTGATQTDGTKTDERRNGNLANLSTADLVSRATQQVSTLVRDELALARAELTEKAKRAGQGGALFAVAGLVAFLGLGALVATLIAALSTVLPVWLAALIVTLALFLVAGVAVLIGRNRLKAATPLMPVESTEGLTADVATVRRAVQDGLHEGKQRD